jgi:adenylate cyclase class 2
VVSDFERARQLLEALGYSIALVYEKYRTGYDIGAMHIALDEMPYGDFLEIEGPDVQTIQALNQKLGLEWEAGVTASYTTLFEQLKMNKKLDFRDLSFENFRGLKVNLEDLGVQAAD